MLSSLLLLLLKHQPLSLKASQLQLHDHSTTAFVTLKSYNLVSVDVVIIVVVVVETSTAISQSFPRGVATASRLQYNYKWRYVISL